MLILAQYEFPPMREKQTLPVESPADNDADCEEFAEAEDVLHGGRQLHAHTVYQGYGRCEKDCAYKYFLVGVFL